MVSVGTYRSVCGQLLHCRVDVAGGVRWEIEDDDGSTRIVVLAEAAEVLPLSDDPDWPSSIGRCSEPVLEPD